jgi:hypothetical protein
MSGILKHEKYVIARILREGKMLRDGRNSVGGQTLIDGSGDGAMEVEVDVCEVVVVTCA